ncbi:MAG: hypothetical protein AXA67_05320 [Methylothermaceae bacteria B42]|nr:MAG: hypothetical protein AXA67_05320 [Methylothermaceae bacteria B42]HHJ39388.1 Y-family DNA polymerase [Methylothermaceae bacterium]
MPSTEPCFALVDCNNFYVSCERLFRPDLWRRPVVVLSNNDGCVIARSNEVKALGVPMGAPYHEVAALLRRHNAEVFSSNFPLYADLSARIMSVLEGFTPHLEIYSIDEAFLDWSGLPQNKARLGVHLKQTLWRWVGLPVSVGIGPTKTLAKVANEWAKKISPEGVVDLMNPRCQKEVLLQMPVGGVWGIGRRLAAKLSQIGIKTAWDLRCADSGLLQSRYSIVVTQTALELQGKSCLQVETVVPPRKEIRCSRSFRPKLTELSQLHSALSEFCCRAAEKLRQQRSLAHVVTVFLRSDAFDPKKPCYQPVLAAALRTPSQDSRWILKCAGELLEKMYRPGYRYQQCGILLGGLVSEAEGNAQLALFNEEISQKYAGASLMEIMDRVNRRFPNGLFLGASVDYRRYRYRPQQLSPAFTTRWNELPVVKA